MYYAAFYDEIQKIAKTVVMKPLSSAAKRFMERMTGATHGASIPQPTSARRLTRALTGRGSPELMTEMHGMGGLLSPGERAAKGMARQHYEGVLRQQGKVYKAAPGLEQQIGSIAGHPRALTRTGAQVGAEATAAATPSALRSAAPVSGTAMTVATPLRKVAGLAERMARLGGRNEVAGLGVLAAPSVDDVIARIRARRAGAEEGELDKFRMLKEKYHGPIEIAGLGMLAAPYIGKRLTTGQWGH